MSGYVPNKLRGVLGGPSNTEGVGGKVRSKGRKSRPWRVDAASWKQQLHERKAVYDHFALPENLQEEEEKRRLASSFEEESEEIAEETDKDGGVISLVGSVGNVEVALIPADERRHPLSPNKPRNQLAPANSTPPSIKLSPSSPLEGETTTLVASTAPSPIHRTRGINLRICSVRQDDAGDSDVLSASRTLDGVDIINTNQIHRSVGTQRATAAVTSATTLAMKYTSDNNDDQERNGFPKSHEEEMDQRRTKSPVQVVTGATMAMALQNGHSIIPDSQPFLLTTSTYKTTTSTAATTALHTSSSLDLDIDDYDDDGIMACRSSVDDDDDQYPSTLSSPGNNKWQELHEHNENLQQEEDDQSNEDDDDDGYDDDHEDMSDEVSLGTIRSVRCHQNGHTTASNSSVPNPLIGKNGDLRNNDTDVEQQQHRETLSNVARHDRIVIREHRVVHGDDSASNGTSSSLIAIDGSATATLRQTLPPLTTTPSFDDVLKEQEDLVQKALAFHQQSATSATTVKNDRCPAEKTGTDGEDELLQSKHKSLRPSLSIDTRQSPEHNSTVDEVDEYCTDCHDYDDNDGNFQRLDTPHPVLTHEFPASFSIDSTMGIRPSSTQTVRVASYHISCPPHQLDSPAGQSEPAASSTLPLLVVHVDPDPLQRARKNWLLSDLQHSLKNRRIMEEQEEEGQGTEDGYDVNETNVTETAAGEAPVTESPAAVAIAESGRTAAENSKFLHVQAGEDHRATAKSVEAEDDQRNISNALSLEDEQRIAVTDERGDPKMLRHDGISLEGTEYSNKIDLQTTDRMEQHAEMDHEATSNQALIAANVVDAMDGDEEEDDDQDNVVESMVDEKKDDGQELEVRIENGSTKLGNNAESRRLMLLAEMTERLQAIYTGNHHCIERSGQAIVEPPIILTMRKEPSPLQKESRGGVIEELTAIVSTLPTGHHHVVESPSTNATGLFSEDGMAAENGEGIVLAPDDNTDDKNCKPKKRRESAKAKKWKERLANKKLTKRDSTGSSVPEETKSGMALPSAEPPTATDTDKSYDSTCKDNEPEERLRPRSSSAITSILDQPEGVVRSMNGEGNNALSSSSLSDSGVPSDKILLMSPSSNGSKTELLSPARSTAGSKTLKWKQRLAKIRGSQHPDLCFNEGAATLSMQSRTEMTGTIVTIRSVDYDETESQEGPSVPMPMADDSVWLTSQKVSENHEEASQNASEDHGDPAVPLNTTFSQSHDKSNSTHQSEADAPAANEKSSHGFRDNLRQSFSAFDALLKERPSLPIDDESVWTEVTEITLRQPANAVAAAMPALAIENHKDEEQSYMEFTVEESVQPSFIEETIASGSVQYPKLSGPNDKMISPFMSTLLSSRMFQGDLPPGPPVATQQRQKPQSHVERNSQKFPTIMVESHADDDMTQITFDHSLEEENGDDEKDDRRIEEPGSETKEEFFDAFSNQIPSGPKSEKSAKSRSSLKSRKSTKSQKSELSTSSHHSSETSKQRIAEILRKEIWRRDVSAVQSAVEELDKEAANGSRYRAHIVRCGGVMAIMRTMEMNTESEAIQIPCCRTLEKLALEPETQAAICEMEGIPLIVRTMQDHAHSVAFQEAACAALAIICRHQEADYVNDPMKEANGAVVTLLTSMSRYSDNGRIQEKGFAAISNLCMESPERLAELSEAGGIITLTMALQRPWENKNDQHQAISHLSILLRGITELNERSTVMTNITTRNESDSDHTTFEELEELPKATETKLEGTSRTSEESSSLSTRPDDASKHSGKGGYNKDNSRVNEEYDSGDHSAPHTNGVGFGLSGKDAKDVEGHRGRPSKAHLDVSIDLDNSASTEFPEIPNIPSNDEASESAIIGENSSLDQIDGKADEKCTIQ